MKRNNFKYGLLLAGLQLFFACTPDDPTYRDNDIVDINSITSIKLHPNHMMVLADGKAALDFNPALYCDSVKVVDHRVEDCWLEFHTLEGQTVERKYTTSDIALCGSEVKVYACLKGRDIYSDTVSFTIEKPLEPNLQEIVIPVIFHIVQTTEDIVSYGGSFTCDRIKLILSKLNNAFSGEVSVNPVGVNTKILFRPALFDPSGSKLDEPGIHRFETDEINSDNFYTDFLKQEKLIWEPEHYMNIWIVSDGNNTITNFGYNISQKCKPKYKTAGTSDEPEGLGLVELPAGHDWQPLEAGLIYKLQLFNLSSFIQGKTQDNTFIYYVGNYLGLLPTWGYKLYGNTVAAQDYCTDTQKYTVDMDDKSQNTGWEKVANKTFHFTAENIMDDQIALHRSISKDQCLRIRWVLQNCPERAFWKSRFAFEGK